MPHSVMQNKFHPAFTDESVFVKWIEEGDVAAAEDLAQQLAMFLELYSQNPNARKAMSLQGLPPLGARAAELIAKRLRDKGGAETGKQRKSGVELFKKFLVPGKPSKSKFSRRKLAYWVYINRSNQNDTSLTKDELQRITSFFNQVIESNNKALSDWKKKGLTADYEKWNSSLPERRVTENEVEKAYREYLEAIKKENGIQTHRISG